MVYAIYTQYMPSLANKVPMRIATLVKEPKETRMVKQLNFLQLCRNKGASLSASPCNIFRNASDLTMFTENPHILRND